MKRSKWRFLRIVLVTVMWTSIIAVPILGVWFVSSTAMTFTRVTAVGLIVSCLVFPALPIAWELWSTRRARRRARPESEDDKPRLFSLSTRLILRTLAVHVTLLALLVGLLPDLAVAAVSARGDWFLEPLESETSEAMRPFVWGVASVAEYMLLGSDVKIQGDGEIRYRDEYESAGLELVSPKRGPVIAENGSVQLHVRNPRDLPIIAFVRTGDSVGEILRNVTPCTSKGSNTDLHFTCPTPAGESHSITVANRDARGCPIAVTFDMPSR